MSSPINQQSSRNPFVVAPSGVVRRRSSSGIPPRLAYFLRLPLEGGWATEEGREFVRLGIAAGNRPDFDDPAARYQVEVGAWPADWRRQLAVAADVPLREIDNVGVGGPMQLAELHGLPLAELLRSYAEAFAD